MDYFYFVLIILALIAAMYLLSRVEKNTKIKYKKTAYSLLETDRPDPKEIKGTIKGLRIYGGRFFKDKECIQLVQRLITRLDTIER